MALNINPIWDFEKAEDERRTNDGTEITRPFKIEEYEDRIVIEISRSVFRPLNHPTIREIRTSVQRVTIWARTSQERINGILPTVSKLRQMGIGYEMIIQIEQRLYQIAFQTTNGRQTSSTSMGGNSNSNSDLDPWR